MATTEQVQKKIREHMEALTEILLEKNRRYGNSAIEPIRVFSQASSTEQILVRLDDKLSRFRNMQSQGGDDEDVVMDLIGYLVLYRIATELQKEES